MKSTIGIDIGGANIKYARLADSTDTKSTDALTHSRFFPMWRQSETLADVLAKDLRTLGPADSLAITMTGELADCFIDREIGVAHIADHVLRAAEEHGVQQLLFYGVDGQFYSHEYAVKKTDLIAASNWHALASYVGQRVAQDALLIDIGSTTTDIIPIKSGEVATNAQTDYDRLREGSLVYVGCRRTPVCSLVDRLTFRGQDCRVMNEFFATIDDACLVLGLIDEQPQDCDTADNQPRAATFAANRLSRMVGLDRRTVTASEASRLAEQVIRAARLRIQAAIGPLSERFGPAWVISGHGGYLLDLPSDHNHTELANTFGGAISRSAPAFAVAHLLAASRSHPAS